MKGEQERWLIETEVSQLTHMALSTLRNHRNLNKGIPYYKISKSVRYKLSDVLQFMESHRIQTHE